MGQYDNVLGPVVLSVFINTYLSGLVGFQYVTYQNIKFKDSWSIKSIVIGLCLIDVFQVLVAIYMAWVYCVANYVNPTAMDHVALWTYTVIPLCNALSGVIAHSFLAYRLSALTKRKIFPVMVGIFTFAAFILGTFSGIYGTARQVSMNSSLSHVALYRYLVVCWLSVQTYLDVMISASLIYGLLQDGRQPIDRSNSKLSQAVDTLVQTGSFGALFSVSALVFFLLSSTTNIYVVFLLPLGRLYSNSVLSTLITRETPMPLLSSQIISESWTQGTKDIWARRRDRNQSFSLIQIRTDREVITDNGDSNYVERHSISRRTSDVEQSNSDDKRPLEKIPEIIVQ
ncbi:hypothetical protein GALMADRAFT_577128 [Galerina marginata CBS 339.88]|uniref:DUF6534 domain-containing protein n=1 Tax=Galerina marginata (strain CBS 339.88) TaxID=685588 RepID=A0A067T5M5_GALM3|nr:hypothetical protein GALMADRAFT_577128 [Galerina marginata CBS 339.88]